MIVRPLKLFFFNLFLAVFLTNSVMCLPIKSLKISGLTGHNFTSTEKTWGVDFAFDTDYVPPDIVVTYYQSSGQDIKDAGKYSTQTTESQVGLRWYKSIAFGQLAYGAGFSTITTQVTNPDFVSDQVSSSGAYGQVGITSQPRQNWSVGLMATYSSSHVLIDNLYRQTGGLYFTGSLGRIF